MHEILQLGGLTLEAESISRAESVGGGLILRGRTVTVTHTFHDGMFFRQGWNSWSPTGWRALSDEPLRIYNNPERLLTADDAVNDTPDRHSASAVGAVQARGDEMTVLLGSLELGAPRVSADSEFLVGTTEGGPDSRWFLAVGDADDVFAAYSVLLKQEFGETGRHAGNVWGSWYSFYEDIDEQGLTAAISELTNFPIDVIQVDDGWERAVGDWQANEKFPSGLGGLVAKILDAGFRPGLWLSPLICVPDSALAIEHKDWLVCGQDGEPLIAGYNWGTHYFTLDTTLHSVREYLRDLFTSLVDLGFSYFKLDFMYAGALPGVRSTDEPRESVYRSAIKLIRSVVGDDTYLLGSGVPMNPSIGVFDGVRVGPDVAPYWDNSERHKDPSGASALNGLRASVNRLWMKELYELDTDAVFFRSRRNLLDEAARRSLADLAVIAGFRSTSDPIGWLDEHEREELREFFESRPLVRKLGWYRYLVDDRLVDFDALINPIGRLSDRLLVK